MSVVTKPNNQQELIEARIDKGVAGSLSVAGGAVKFASMNEVMEFAKVMAIAGQAVPPHLRNQPGFCLAICIQAIEWRFSPFAVANKSYVVNDKVGYESQLIHAVIEERAPIIGRLRHRFTGEGDKRRCTVWANVRGEEEPLEYTSPEFATIHPKNSPLWKSKPDLQLYYNTSRDWARVYFPEVILGVYSEEELDGVIDVNPSHSRSKTEESQETRTQRLASKLASMRAVEQVVDEQVDGGLTDEEKAAILKKEAEEAKRQS